MKKMKLEKTSVKVENKSGETGVLLFLFMEEK